MLAMVVVLWILGKDATPRLEPSTIIRSQSLRPVSSSWGLAGSWIGL